jgi:DNA-binding transcriptional MocR family regulator
MAPDRRNQLVEFASDRRIFIVEDDTYRELSYDGQPPPSLWSIAPPGSVVRLGSFAKSVAPGLRVGYVTAAPDLVQRIINSGLLDSGGGVSHFAAVVLGEYAVAGDYLRQVVRFRDEYRRRRDALLRGLADHLPSDAHWSTPAGGFFVWVSLPDMASDQLLSAALARGVGFMPGQAFYPRVSRPAPGMRLAFSMYPPQQLTTAARRLAAAVSIAAAM